MTSNLAISSPNVLIPTDELLTAFSYFLNIDVADGDAASDTVRSYLCQLQQFLNWCDRTNYHPATITRQEIKEYRRWLLDIKQYKPATIALKLTAVRRFYDAAIERGLLTINPATGIKAPREKKDPAARITYLEKDEVSKLLDTVGDEDSLKTKRDKILIGIMVLEGTRTVEMYRSNLVDIVQQGDNIGVKVEGKRNIRVVPLTPNLASDLKIYLDARKAKGEKLTKNTPLFIAIGNRAGGKRLSRRGIRQIIDGYLQTSQLKYLQGRTISAHSLRHTAATLALRGGAELRQVQDLLGHSDPRVTAIYTHVGDRWQNNPALFIFDSEDS
jgi:site-specific recombinase XerD